MALYSDLWHRVGTLHPRLVPQLRVRRQQLRGATWYLLADEASGRSCRLNPAAYALAGRLDGRSSVQQLWERLQGAAGEPPTQDETVEMLAQLRECGLVEFDRPADFTRWLPHLQRARGVPRRFNPLAWRLPLADPSRLLEQLQPLVPKLISRAAGVLWLMAVAWLAWQAAQQAGALAAYGEAVLGSSRFAFFALLLYPPIKLVHELSHGLAVRRFGGAVHEAGVTLMLGLPVPYVDASAASAFPRRWQRALVSAAGIAAELAVAALALAAWLALGDGPLREAAFAALVIASVSTLLFNANPLQRLDGYYIACDLLQLPNLATRSRQYWRERLQVALGVPGVQPMPLARGEQPWLVAYAPLSWAWLLVIVSLATLWLAQFSALLGVAAALAFGWQAGLKPPLTLARDLRRAALASGAARQRLRVATAVLALALAAMLALPLPQQTVALGVVWPAERAQLRAGSDGFVALVHRHDGERVEAGELVLELADPRLAAQRERQAARIEALESELFGALPADPARSADLEAALQAARAEASRLAERMAGLQVRAAVAGTLALPQAADLLGRHQRQGRLLGQVLTGEPPLVRVALPEDRALVLRQRLQRVDARLADAPGRRHQARLQRDAVAAVHELPSAALGQRHGGRIDTDPADAEGLRTVQPVVLIDVQLDAAPVGVERLGTRAWVRFDEGRSPLAAQWLHALRRQWLQRSHPQG
jgi:putative peptide zinc metalloprotease protein